MELDSILIVLSAEKYILMLFIDIGWYLKDLLDRNIFRPILGIYCPCLKDIHR